jgi:hypothetical protein
MNTDDWFEIECVDGASATIYLNGGLTSAHIAKLREACDALPLNVRVLRVQLMAATDVDALPLSIGEVLRHWRQTRQKAFHLVMTAARFSREMPHDPGEHGNQLTYQHVPRIVHTEKHARRADEKSDRDERRGERRKRHRVAEGDGHRRGRVPRGK